MRHIIYTYLTLVFGIGFGLWMESQNSLDFRQTCSMETQHPGNTLPLVKQYGRVQGGVASRF
jgi:hypothetical protein